MTERIWVLVLLAACRAPFNDPDQTGILVSPTPGDYEGPIDLVVRNRTGGTISCVGFETDHCPSQVDFLQGLASVPDGEAVTAEQVECAYVDIVCTESGWVPSVPPLRSWGWAVNPPIEEE